jgi:ABC-type branched-subunit amino acid transport system ATPase component/ABC-type branched-subunit amino acid transport system permease subunit
LKPVSASAAQTAVDAPAPPASSRRRLPLGGWGLLPLAGAVFLIAFPFASDDLFWQNMIILSTLFAIGAVGLNIISGWGGYISLGQSAFVGVGAYTVGLGALEIGGDPFVWVPVAGIVAGLLAMLMGLIAMRTRGHSFVILTIGFLFLLQLIAINWDGLTNGTQGLSLPIPTWDIAYQYWPFYYALLAILALSLLTAWRIRRTKFGTGLIAMREDEDKAATVGVNTPVYKMLGFVASGVFLGMAGGVYAYYLAFIDPRGMFDIVISVQIILCMLLGGRGTLWGPVLGAFLIEPLNELANQQMGGGNSRLLIFGGLMALVVLFLPKGILPTVQQRLIARRTRGQAGLVGARLDGPLVIGERTAPAETSVAAGDTLLEVRGLSKHFGGVKALDGASFAVPQGSITALIGPNGSGKTTAFNLIDGTMTPSSGQVWLEGRRIDDLPPYRRAHLGLARTFQITRLFREMTVLENVVAPLRSFSWRQLNTSAIRGDEAARAEELLAFVGMERFRDQQAGALSYGQQKLVELAQVLMLDPKLILLDEPAGGINPTLIARMGEMIRTLNRQGTTFLIVEHNMPFVLGLCDPVLVLARGACICEGAPDQVQKDPRVLDAYLGEDFVLEDAVEVTR